MERIVQDINAAGTAHTNTTTEGTLAQVAFIGAGGGNPSNTKIRLDPGKKFRIRGLARVTASNSTDTATMAARWGTNATTPASNTAVGTSDAVDVANDDLAMIDAILEVHSATRAVIHGRITDPDANNSKLSHDFGAVLTIAADTAYYFDWTADWSVASASNSIQAEAFTVTELV